ncbi:MAG: hypothetical protein KBT53_03705 [Porticoccus sp.]|nr:hypothetical protein [Porticoccus sp.]MBQ0806385.1 hypothetical protein [Porticoccus sp.]
MFDTSPHTLKLLAAFVWYGGVVALLVKSASLLLAAKKIYPDENWVWLAASGGIVLGVIKAKYLFRRLCLKNIQRIDALVEPKLWHFYRIRFFVLLFTMVTLGSMLSRAALAQGNYSMLIVMAFVDLSVGIALLGSSHCFWKKLEN